MCAQKARWRGWRLSGSWGPWWGGGNRGDNMRKSNCYSRVDCCSCMARSLTCVVCTSRSGREAVGDVQYISRVSCLTWEETDHQWREWNAHKLREGMEDTRKRRAERVKKKWVELGEGKSRSLALVLALSGIETIFALPKRSARHARWLDTEKWSCSSENELALESAKAEW